MSFQFLSTTKSIWTRLAANGVTTNASADLPLRQVQRRLGESERI